MSESFIVGTLEFAKVLIAIFVMNYSFFFLKRTEDAGKRKAWGALYIASLFLFVVESISALQFFRAGMYLHPPTASLKSIAEFSFLSCFLFWFIYNHEALTKK